MADAKSNKSKTEETLKQEVLTYLHSERVKAFEDDNEAAMKALDDAYRAINAL